MALARALGAAPEVVIADEITSALDVSVQGAVLNLVRDLQRETGTSMLFISHNLAVVRYVATSIAVMYLGRIVEHGPTADVLNEPQHPYTRDLLAALPDPGHTGLSVLGPLPGDHQDPAVVEAAQAEPADPHHPPAGCRYHPRCPIGPLTRPDRDICRTVEPTSRHSNRAACHFAADLAGATARTSPSQARPDRTPTEGHHP